MKKRLIEKVILIIFLAMSLSIVGISQKTEDPGVMLRSAIEKEEVDGDLKGAIDLYQKIIDKFSGNKAIAAQAQLRIGICFEKLGQKSLKQAQDAFQKVIDNFPGQDEAVREAREKLATLRIAQAVIKEEDKGIVIRKMWADDLTSDYGSPSPDGKYFAFHHYRSGDLAIREFATGEVRRLYLKKTYAETLESVGHCCWSPDGKQIAYEWTSNPTEIRIVNMDGSNPRTVYKDPDWVSPYSWSPDGKQILTFLMKKDRGKYQFGLLNVKDGSMREFDLHVDPSSTQGFSPDGRYLALSVPQEDDSNKKDISLYSLAEEEEIPLVEHPSDDSLMGWAPDGQWVFFWSDRSGTPDLWAIRISDGKSNGDPVLIKKGVGNPFNVWLTKTGVLYYSINISMRDVYVAKIDFNSNKVLESPKRATEHYINTNFAPSWSPDGEYLAFASRREDVPQRVLCILTIKTGEVHEILPQIISFRNPTIFHWSSDGQSIVHTGFDKPYGRGIFKTDLKTGNMDVLLRDDPGQIRGSCLSRDGKTMFYNKMDGKTKMSQLLALNLETQKIEELYVCEFMQGLALSPDEGMLAFSEDVWEVEAERELKILPVAGGEPRSLYTTRKGGWISTLAWTPDGRYILFSQNKAENEENKNMSSLWIISPQGGELQEIGITMDSFDHLRIHPDGQHIAFTSGAKGKEVWKMENFLPKTKDKK